jgi:hypothetical protein
LIVLVDQGTFNMCSLATMRRLGPWLLGLFLIAHMAGVVPLICFHTMHLFDGQPAISDGPTASTAVDRSHHPHGTTDAKDECCSMHHHLAGVLAPLLTTASISFASMPVAVSPQDPLHCSDPILLDRPPKFLSLI